MITYDASVVSYPLGRPLGAASRGGDCRARDLGQGRNIHGHHRFAAPADCQISNGLVRLTVGAAGVAPSLTIQAWRGPITVADTYEDVYTDIYGGDIGTPAWLAVGAITIDSTLLTALLTAVQIARISPEAITIRLVSPVMADAFVTLRRGERQVRIQHGNTRGPQVSTNRRVRWTDSPAIVGTSYTNRVEEINASAGLDGFHRFVGAIDPATVNVSAFSVTAAGTTSARFGAGVGTTAARDGAMDLHSQLGDASRPRMVVSEYPILGGWTTATLLNGFTSAAGDPIQYRYRRSTDNNNRAYIEVRGSVICPTPTPTISDVIFAHTETAAYIQYKYLDTSTGVGFNVVGRRMKVYFSGTTLVRSGTSTDIAGEVTDLRNISFAWLEDGV